VSRRGPALAAALALAAVLAPARPLAAQAQLLELTYAPTFAARNQSIWNAGPAVSFEQSYTLSRSWNRAGGVNAIVGSRCQWILGHCVDTRTGVAVSGMTHGSVTFDARARVNSGSLDGDASARARLFVARPSPTPDPGDVVSLKSAIDERAVAFSTQGPSVQARAAVSGSVFASMSGAACFIGAGCAAGTTTLVDLPAFSQEIASYNWDNSGTLKLLGHDIPGFNFGEPIDLPVPGASFTLYTPQLHVSDATGTTRAVGTARTDLARVDLDPLQLGLNLFSPAAACVLSCSIDLEVFDVDYTLFSAEVGAVVGLRQELALTLARPFTRYDFSMPTRVRQGGGWSAPVTSVVRDGWSSFVEVEYVEGTWGIPLEVTPTYGMVGSLRNTTFLTIDPSISLTVLEAEALGYSFGPLYENEWRWDGLSLQLYSATFEVPMGTYTGQRIALGAWPAMASPGLPGEPPPPPPADPWSGALSTPEPGSLALAATGLALLAAAAARARRRAA
jgi:hypothetical protein